MTQTDSLRPSTTSAPPDGSRQAYLMLRTVFTLMVGALALARLASSPTGRPPATSPSATADTP